MNKTCYALLDSYGNLFILEGFGEFESTADMLDSFIAGVMHRESASKNQNVGSPLTQAKEKPTLPPATEKPDMKPGFYLWPFGRDE